MNNDQKIARLFSALAHPSRITILRALLARGDAGLQFGELADEVGLAASTLTHHLREMEDAGVLVREPLGRSTRLRLDLSALEATVVELTSLCCSRGQPRQ